MFIKPLENTFNVALKSPVVNEKYCSFLLKMSRPSFLNLYHSHMLQTKEKLQSKSVCKLYFAHAVSSMRFK